MHGRAVAALLFLTTAAPLAAQRAPAATAPDPVPVRRSNAEIAAAVDEYMSRIVPFGFSGALLVARDGEVLLEKGYGLADRARGAPYTGRTVATVGSITKQFTAAAILRLEMEGKLRVTDPVSKYLSGVPSDKRGITLHHLLTHSAGLEDGFGGDYDVAERDSLMRVILASPLKWAPGTRYAYSNAGYSMLGAVVEIVSGQGYERYLRDRLFLPAGMRRTGYLLPGWREGELVHGYRGGEDWGTSTSRPWAPDGPWWNLRANGGILSTVGDLYRWHRALEGTAILSEEAKRKMWTPHVPEDEEGRSHYGYGWAIFTTQRGTKLIAHNGGNGVFYADFRRYVDEGVVIIVMTNVAELPGERALPQVQRIVFGMPFTQPPAVAPAAAEALAARAGTYRFPSGATVTVAASGGGLSLTAEGAEAFTLLASGARTDAALEALGARAVAAVEAGERGDYAPFHRLLGARMPLERAREMQEGAMGRWKERLGAFRAARHLGTYRAGEDPVTVLRLEFERGAQLLRMTWEGDAVAGLRPVGSIPPRLFHPEAGAPGLVTYDLATGHAVRLRFDGDALVFPTPDGDARATRAGAAGTGAER